MTKESKPAEDGRQLPELGEELSRNEIMAVLADDGYTSSGREGWLKTVLTRLTTEETDNPDANRAELISEIKKILNKNVSGESEAEDTL